MLNILFEKSDIIEIRCLHKDQVVKNGRTEPAPRLFWGTYEELQTRAMFDELSKLNRQGYNIYYGANPRAGKSKSQIACCRSLFVDLDGDNHHMDLEEARQWLSVVCNEWMVPYPTLTLSSGNGIHFYWRINRPMSPVEWHKAQKALIATFNLTSRIADPCIHDAPRIMRLPGFANCRGGVVADVIESSHSQYMYDDFELCFDNLPKEPEFSGPAENYAGDNANALERALKYFEHRDGCSEGGRNAECYKIAACCQNDFGLSEPDTYQVIATWNQKNRPALPESEIKQVIQKAKRHSARNPDYSKDRPKPTQYRDESGAPSTGRHENDQIPAEANTTEQYDKPAPKNIVGVNLEVVEYMVENYVLIAGTCDVWDIEHGIKMPVNALSLIYPEEIKFWKRDFNRKIIRPENLVFEPSGNVPDYQINTFRGIDFKEDTRPMPLLHEHIEMLCEGDQKVMEWLISWMAFQVQHPGQKLATSIIMHGKQGTGKSMLWECFGSMFEPYFAVIDQTILESDFNSWASRKMFVLAEEVLANRSKSKLKNVIKQMVTGGRIQINQKFSQPWYERCHMNMVFLSNNRLPMLLDEDDRRFMVIRTDDKQDDQYYINLAAEIADNGPARLYSFLKSWNLQGFHAHTKPLNTLAKEELIQITRDTSKVFLDEWLTGQIEGLPLSVCRKTDLYEAYLVYCKQSNCRANSRNHFYQIIAEEYPVLSEGRCANFRVYIPSGYEQISYTQFEESLNRIIGQIQDRRI